jgi:hypothetical protein
MEKSPPPTATQSSWADLDDSVSPFGPSSEAPHLLPKSISEPPPRSQGAIVARTSEAKGPTSSAQIIQLLHNSRD